MGTNLSNKYILKLLDSAKKSTTDAIKTASKRATQKTAQATRDLIGNKIADKITSVSKSFKKWGQQSCTLNNYKIMKLIMNQKYQKKYTYLHKNDGKLLMN